MHQIAVDVKGGFDFVVGHHTAAYRPAYVFEQRKADGVGRWILFVVAHEVNQLGIFLAGNAVGPVVLQHIVGYAVQYFRRESPAPCATVPY